MGNEANHVQKWERIFVTNNTTNNPLKKKSTVIVVVLLAIGVALALTSWLIFGNVYELGMYIAVYIALMTWSFLTGLFIGKQQRKFLWFACVFVSLGITVVVLKFLGLISYVLSVIYSLSAFLSVIAGTLIRRKKERRAEDSE